MLKSNKMELIYCQNSVISGVVKMRGAVIINYNKSCYFILYVLGGGGEEWMGKKEVKPEIQHRFIQIAF